ncbi:MAG: NAD+ synthase [Bdellovibrionaceae bacterium]|nr:NAD+ synthase [Pseudobdellovibrionaceae bacterium]
MKAKPGVRQKKTRKKTQKETRIGIAQIDSTLGDFKTNKTKILEAILKAEDRKCSMVVFPECALFGYHPFDMLERTDLIEYQNRAFSEIVRRIPKDMAVIFGLLTINEKKKGRPYFNSAVLLIRGKKPKFFNKQLLPTGDVFDEARFVEPGDLTKNYFTWKGARFFLTICEDIWGWPNPKGYSAYKENPLSKVPKQKVDLVINLSASPFHLGKMQAREYMTRQTTLYFKAPLLYVNLVGAQDEIIFDGTSFLMSQRGRRVFSCESFREDFNVFDLKTHKHWSAARALPDIEKLRRALVLGIQDFCRKVGFDRVHLGLSGGIDSALVSCLAVDALGSRNVRGIGIPGPHSTPESLTLARQLSERLGIEFSEISINSTYHTVIEALAKNFDHRQFNIVNENVQARLRGLFLMAYANQNQSLLLTTGNKSEYATGYATLYGDMCGGLAPIGDLTKKQVYQLAELYNSQHEVIPPEIIKRAPTAELRPNQKDQDTLPSYEVLDESVERLVTRSKMGKTTTDKWLSKVLMKTEFKRWQAAPILKVSEHSFGRGRRWPVAHKAWIY